MLGKYALFTEYVDDIINDTMLAGRHELTNPGVQVALVYGSHLPTPKSLTWDYDMLGRMKAGDYAIPSKAEFTNGDSTVSSTSSLMPGFKWAYEYIHGLPNSKPIKAIEYCSIYNNKESIYDGFNDIMRRMEKVEYIGLPCECLSGSDENRIAGELCHH